jgi:hypothetical protein
MGVGTKILLVMMSITIMLMFSGYNTLPMQTGMFNMTYNNTTDTFTMPNNDSAQIMEANNSLIPTVPMFGWFNSFALVYDTVLLVVSIFFAPVTTLITVGAPAIMIAMVGALWVTLYIIALLTFIRGWDF